MVRLGATVQSMEVRRARRGGPLVEEFAKPAAREGGATLLTGTPHTDHAVKLLERSGFHQRSKKAPTRDPIADKLSAAAPKTNTPWDCPL